MIVKRIENLCNCYIVSDDDGNAAVIDPCIRSNEISEMLKQNNLNLCCVILTHAHFDHICGLSQLLSESKYKGIPVYIGAADAAAVSDENKNLSMPLFHEPYKYTGTLDILNDGDKVKVGKLVFEVLSCPGHTEGCTCFAEMNEHVIFSGDVLFEGSVGRTDFPGGSMEKMIDSLKKLLKFGNNMLVYPGHGESTTIGDEKKFNPYLIHITK